MAEIIPVIGLEVHAELATESKIFCSCSTEFGAPPNTHTCPVCLGLPGVLPVINKKVLDFAIRLAIALNCRILPYSKMDRKNYYYPDLPKNYQISQNYLPFAVDGYVEIDAGGEVKRVRINNMHIEEDAGKNIHAEDTGLFGWSLVDFNRAGVPLVEIVTEPDMHSLEEVEAFMETLREILLYTEVSDCKMEEGSLRFEANVSVKRADWDKLGARVEMKNLNSFKAVLKALEYEIERQSRILEQGGVVEQETRLWDPKRGVTRPMRTKEYAHDYRYFPEPDLVPIIVDEAWIEEIRAGMPELPRARRKRFVAQYGIPEYDAQVLTSDKKLADFFEECCKLWDDYKAISNWIMVELMKLLNDTGKSLEEASIKPEHVVEVIRMIKEGKITGNVGKEVFQKSFHTGKSPAQIVEEENLAQISDVSALEGIVDEVIENNPKAVADFKSGKEKALAFLMGMVMKATRGQANPQLVQKLLREKLSK